MANGNIYYDPGIKMENVSTKPKIKKSGQFRIKSQFLPNLYNENEIVDSGFGRRSLTEIYFFAGVVVK